MNNTQVGGDWDQMKYRIKNRWTELLDEDIEQVKGRKYRLVEILIDRFDLTPEDAEYEVDVFWH